MLTAGVHCFLPRQQGHCDYPLTDLGINQAKALGLALQTQSWDSIYSSDLFRALRTCGIALEPNPHHPSRDGIQKTELIREISFGVREALSRAVTLEQATEEFARRNKISIAEVVDTAESMGQVKDRQVRFIQKLYKDLFALSSASSSSDDEREFRVLAVSHGGFIKQFVKNFCPDVNCPGKIGNCAVSTFDIVWVDDGTPKNLDRKFKCTIKEKDLNVVYQQS
jgi:broad specificity phosphatase PhoE